MEKPECEVAIDLFNCLLEQLHQTGHAAHGSNIEIVYVAAGGQHINTQNNYYDRQQKPDKNGHTGALPDELSTEAAMALWQKAQQAGYVDESYQPLLSRSQSALLADAMAKRLGIKEKWKTFETLWNRKNMYRDYYKALSLQQSLAFQDELKRHFY